MHSQSSHLPSRSDCVVLSHCSICNLKKRVVTLSERKKSSTSSRAGRYGKKMYHDMFFHIDRSRFLSRYVVFASSHKTLSNQTASSSHKTLSNQTASSSHKTLSNQTASSSHITLSNQTASS